MNLSVGECPYNMREETNRSCCSYRQPLRGLVGQCHSLHRHCCRREPSFHVGKEGHGHCFVSPHWNGGEATMVTVAADASAYDNFWYAVVLVGLILGPVGWGEEYCGVLAMENAVQSWILWWITWMSEFVRYADAKGEVTDQINNRNHPFTQTIYHSLYYILSGLCEGILSGIVWRDGLCEGVVWVQGWFVWRDQDIGIVWRDGLCDGMVCVKGWIVWGNGPFKQTIPSHKPSLHTNQPFTLTIPSQKPFILLCITYCLVCLKAWTVWLLSIPSHKPSLHTNHPFIQTNLSH